MITTVTPGLLSGTVFAIPSKSQAHRLMILAAFADKPTTLLCPQTNRDIEATAACLNALGASICRTAAGYEIIPIRQVPAAATLNPCESGSTLRFLLPVAGALGVRASFVLSGRLPQRPLSPLWEEMERMGCTLSRPTECTVLCEGKLRPGAYTIDGGVSSQFVSGLLFALSLMNGPCSLTVTGKVESAPYIEMTRSALALFGAQPGKGYPLCSPGTLQVEGDWSNAAFFLAAKHLGSRLEVSNLDPCSPQGDRAIAELLPRLADHTVIDAADIPDLVPILAVVAAGKQGAVFTGIRRLRLKESDRVASVIALLQSLGGTAEADENTLTVHPASFTGGTVDSFGDHRIAMAAAIAATVASSPVTIVGSEATEKSYPTFWAEFARLGGQV